MTTPGSDYGATNGQREQLSGYFDVNNDGVHTKKGRCTVWCGLMSKKKKICMGVTIGIIVLLIVIIVAAVATPVGRKLIAQISGSSAVSGQGCKGDSSAQFNCGSSDGSECILREYMCDGYPDCSQGEDESNDNCKNKCSKEEFRCHVEGNCIKLNTRCDGKLDCGGEDFSDEQNCFSINPNNSEVSITRLGNVFPMSGYMEFRVAETICEELGFLSLRLPIPPGIKTGRFDRKCGEVNLDQYDPAGNANGLESELSNHVDLVNCDRTIGKLALTCQHDFCGVFGDFKGPAIPEGWMGDEFVGRPDIRTPFPWVVNIYQGDKLMCRGAVTSDEWVITSAECIDQDKVFAASNSNYRVVALEMTDNPQEAEVIKVMRNHIKMSGALEDMKIAALQVSRVFNFPVNKACLVEPAWLPHYVCFAAGKGKDGELKHVRVVPQTDAKKCTQTAPDQADFLNLCFTYPHAGEKNSDEFCVTETLGTPVSCLDPNTNSWSFAGVVSTKSIGCPEDNKDSYIGLDMKHQLNFFWTQAVVDTTEPEHINCGNKQSFDTMRFMRGSRYNEFYIDIKGFGPYRNWYTVYNLTSSVNVFHQNFEEKFGNPNIRVVKEGTGIKSKRQAVVECPSTAKSICACDITYREVHLDDEADTLHLVTDFDQDSKIDYGDIDFENWGNETSLDDIYYDYDANLDSQQTVQKPLDFVLEKCSEEKPYHRLCNSTSSTPQCIPDEYVCDSYPDCPQGEDEDRLKCESYKGYECPRDYFRCNSTYECLPSNKLCDGELDCSDGSDERVCVNVDTDMTLLVTHNGVMLPYSGAHNGMNEDELLELGINLCQAGGFGEFDKLTNISKASSEEIFSLGCYKLTSQYAQGSSIKVHTEFTRFRRDLCTTIYKLECFPAQCGLYGEYKGPVVPPGSKRPVIKEEITTEEMDYPWVVHVRKSGRTLCTGTIIHQQWILTSRDCVSQISDDITIVPDNDPLGVTRHICHKVLYTNKGNPRERNLALLSIRPDFNIDNKTRPICLIYPLYLPGSTCFATGLDENNEIKHIKVIPAYKGRCSLETDNPYDSCVEYVGDDKNSMCLNTHGGPLQCIDTLRRRFSLPAIIDGDIGGGCTNGGTTAKSMDMIDVLQWVSEMVEDILAKTSIICRSQPEGGREKIRLQYLHGGEPGQWYMRSEQGEVVTWDTDDSLKVITQYLADLFASPGVQADTSVLEEGQQSNITAVRTIALTACTQDKQCDCAITTHPDEQPVKIFYVTGADPDLKDEQNQEAKDGDGIVYNPDDQEITTPPSLDDESDGILRSDPAHRGLPAGSPGSG